jgi:hypothetical protein
MFSIFGSSVKRIKFLSVCNRITNPIHSHGVGKSTIFRCFSTGERKFYDSQSGQYLTMPGTSGIRLHDMTLSSSLPKPKPTKDDIYKNIELIKKIAILNPSTIEIDMMDGFNHNPSLDSNLDPHSISDLNPKLMVRVTTIDEIKTISKSKLLFTGVIINELNENTENLINYAKTKGLKVRCNLLCNIESFNPNPNPNTNPNLNPKANSSNNVKINFNSDKYLSSIIRLGDYGADCIMIQLIQKNNPKPNPNPNPNSNPNPNPIPNHNSNKNLTQNNENKNLTQNNENNVENQDNTEMNSNMKNEYRNLIKEG